jgi:hypothetical protein
MFISRMVMGGLMLKLPGPTAQKIWRSAWA